MNMIVKFKSYEKNIMKPITPEDVLTSRKKGEHIPEKVIEIVNELILKKWNGYDATIIQKDIVNEIKIRMILTSTNIIFENKWLDFEDFYREVGWRVRYNKPGWDENYDETFIFKKQ